MLVVDAFGELGDKYIIVGWAVDENIEVRRKGKRVDSEVLRIIRKDVNAAMKLPSNFKSGFLMLVDEIPDSVASKNRQVNLQADNEKLKVILNEYLKDESVKKFLGIAEPKVKVAIDNIVKIEDEYYFITGWAVSVEGKTLSIKSNKEIAYSFYPRKDLEALDFIKEKYKNAGFYLIAKDEGEITVTILDEFGNEKELSITLSPNKTFNSIREMSEFILSFVNTAKKGFSKQFENMLGEALKTAYLNYYKNLDLQIEESNFGNTPQNPKLSIIVPLYGRVDFVEFQSAVFSMDRDFLKNVELIYVLDDPDRYYDEIENIMQGAYNIYRVPFKLIKYNHNMGYARANNIGVRFATSDMILLLNSDVFPKEKGWVSKILKRYEELKNPGVLGFKLLYEDESIQHVGMEFKQYPYLDNMWINYHPLKGLPDNKKDELKEVQAVTGACMLMEKKKFQEVGGLSEEYILGDFEDSDICLKLREKGYGIYYSSTPSFYHLERQSQNLFDNKEWKHKITLFNCWQHTKKWNEILQKVTNESIDN